MVEVEVVLVDVVEEEIGEECFPVKGESESGIYAGAAWIVDDSTGITSAAIAIERRELNEEDEESDRIGRRRDVL